MPVADLAELLGDFPQRLVPANTLPLAFAALARPLHRVIHPVGMVVIFHRLPGARAIGGEAGGAVGPDRDCALVGNLRGDVATDAANRANAALGLAAGRLVRQFRQCRHMSTFPQPSLLLSPRGRGKRSLRACPLAKLGEGGGGLPASPPLQELLGDQSPS